MLCTRAPEMQHFVLFVIQKVCPLGAEYPVNTENGALDNASVLKTQQRLLATVQAINAISPAPQVRGAACLPAAAGAVPPCLHVPAPLQPMVLV